MYHRVIGITILMRIIIGSFVHNSGIMDIREYNASIPNQSLTKTFYFRKCDRILENLPSTHK